MTEQTSTEPFIPQAEASMRLGLSPAVMRRLIFSGVLRARRDARGYWQVAERDVERFSEERERDRNVHTVTPSRGLESNGDH